MNIKFIKKNPPLMENLVAKRQGCHFMLNKLEKASAFQLNLLYGTLLGDAYLYKKKGIIQLEQSIQHSDYLFWLFQELKSLTRAKLPKLVTRIDKRTGVTTRSYRFYTRAFFHNWRQEFYDLNDKKKLPDNFENHIDPVSLTVWFLDDRGRSTGVRKGVFFTLDNYRESDVELFQQTLYSRFRIRSSIHKSGRSRSGCEQKRLSITGEQYRTFYHILKPVLNEINPSVLKCMRKFPKIE